MYHLFIICSVHLFVFQEAIMSVLDHKNIDKDVPYFKDVVRYLCSSDCYLLLPYTD